MSERTIAAEADGLTMAYGEGDARVLALDGVSLDLYEGEFTAVMGPSGS
ncbi:ABC transporter ATP-binding protein, partial [Xanthomonas citri pv. citri]|nr:ABC transporter ATP-binding protein [Xanthomonas citri pv. citri]